MKKPDCAWELADLETVPSNGVKVMSTFACGGGSSMGYKRAGCQIVAANDIDPEMAWHYKHNLHPPIYYLCPIKDLMTAKLEPGLFELDILDGSPPCSTFSMAGNREKDWGKDKHFREGQKSQVLSDLFFDFLDLAAFLKPKVVIAENVKGLIQGNAKGYVKLIFSRLKEIGYRPQLFLINAADCGVPQTRERVFFCALRNDIDAPTLKLAPRHRWISAGEATADVQELTNEEIEETRPTPEAIECWPITLLGESFSKGKERLNKKSSSFCRVKLNNKNPSCSLTAHIADFYHWNECRKLNHREWKRLSSFPDDYHAKTDRIGKYMVGMSVPPKMAEVVARAVCTQWLGVVYP
jgi:DNA (cytosine-5)-methyltransferase 1